MTDKERVEKLFNDLKIPIDVSKSWIEILTEGESKTIKASERASCYFEFDENGKFTNVEILGGLITEHSEMTPSKNQNKKYAIAILFIDIDGDEHLRVFVSEGKDDHEAFMNTLKNADSMQMIIDGWRVSIWNSEVVE
jgi:hypothetical protein